MKKKYLVLLLVLLLAGCSANEDASQQKYILCYSKNKSTIMGKSHIVGYDAKGKTVFDDTIDGARYYNVMREKDKYIVDNGDIKNIYDLKGNKEEVEYDESKGDLEAYSYVYYKEKLVSIYNYGGSGGKSSKYVSYLNYNNKDIQIEGLILSFTISDNIVYFLTTTGDILKDDVVLTSINLDEMKIISTEVMDNMENASENEIVGFNKFNDEKYIYYREIKSDINDGRKIREYICRLSLTNNTVEKKELVNKKFSDNFYVFNMFILDDRKYLIADDNKIYEFDYDAKQLFTEVDIDIKHDISYPYDICIKDSKAYILSGDDEKIIYELDINNKKLSEIAKLEFDSDFNEDDYILSGFLVID